MSFARDGHVSRARLHPRNVAGAQRDAAPPMHPSAPGVGPARAPCGAARERNPGTRPPVMRAVTGCSAKQATGRTPRASIVGRPGRSDVPAERPAADPRPRDERELLAPHREPFDPRIAELGAGAHRGQVLRAEPRFLPPRSRVAEMQRTPEQRGEGRGEAHDRTASGPLPAVDLDHFRSAAYDHDVERRRGQTMPRLGRPLPPTGHRERSGIWPNVQGPSSW